MIPSILNKIRAVITISDEEYRNLKKLEIILKYIMELNSKKENVKLYKALDRLFLMARERHLTIVY
jgi:hypothetical protein